MRSLLVAALLGLGALGTTAPPARAQCVPVVAVAPNGILTTASPYGVRSYYGFRSHARRHSHWTRHGYHGRRWHSGYHGGHGHHHG